jgi:predicted DCC family thiol-disulfide oxidoreductase YuxK
VNGTIPFVIVLFDGGCPMCRRTVRRLHRLDWLSRLDFADGTDATRRERFAPGLTDDQIMREMWVIEPHRRTGGYDALLRIASVVPVFWPFLIVGSVPGIRQLGRAVYRIIAARRTRSGRCTDQFCAP